MNKLFLTDEMKNLTRYNRQHPNRPVSVWELTAGAASAKKYIQAYGENRNPSSPEKTQIPPGLEYWEIDDQEGQMEAIYAFLHSYEDTREVEAGAEERQRAKLVREVWHGMRSAAPQLHYVVISANVAQPFPAIRKLAGIEERLVVDEGPDTVFRLIQAGAESVAYYGGAEEIERFARIAHGALSVDGRSLAEGGNRARLAQILSLLGIPPEAISAGLDALAAGMEELEQAA